MSKFWVRSLPSIGQLAAVIVQVGPAVEPSVQPLSAVLPPSEVSFAPVTAVPPAAVVAMVISAWLKRARGALACEES